MTTADAEDDARFGGGDALPKVRSRSCSRVAQRASSEVGSDDGTVLHVRANPSSSSSRMMAAPKNVRPTRDSVRSSGGGSVGGPIVATVFDKGGGKGVGTSLDAEAKATAAAADYKGSSDSKRISFSLFCLAVAMMWAYQTNALMSADFFKVQFPASADISFNVMLLSVLPDSIPACAVYILGLHRTEWLSFRNRIYAAASIFFAVSF